MSLDNDSSFVANSPTKIPTQQAVKTSVTNLQNQINANFDGVSAIGDGRRLFGVVSSSASTGVTCIGAGFTSGDIGKVAIIYTDTGAGTIRTITAVTNSTTIVLSGNAGITTAGGYMIFGTDASTAIQSAIDTASAKSSIGETGNPNQMVGSGKTKITLRGQTPESLFIITSPLIIKSGVVFDCDATIANLIPSRNCYAIQVNRFSEIPKLELEACWGGGIRVGIGNQNRIKIGTLSVWHVKGDTSVVTGVIATPSSTGGGISNGTYYFIITAIDSLGGESALSTEVTQVMSYGTSTGSIALSWTAYPGASSYRVYSWNVSGGQQGYYTTGTNSYTITDIYGGNEGFPVGAGTSVFINGYENQIDRLFIKESKTGVYGHRAGDTQINHAFLIGCTVSGLRFSNSNQVTALTVNLDSCGNAGGTGVLGGLVLDNYCTNISFPNIQAFQITGLTAILPQIINIGAYNANKNTLITIGLQASSTGGNGVKIANAQDVRINQILTNSSYPDSASNAIINAVVYGNNLSGEIKIDSIYSSGITASSGTSYGVHNYSTSSTQNLKNVAISRADNNGASAFFGAYDYLNGAYLNVTGKNYSTFPGKASAEFVIGNDTGADGVKSVFKIVAQDYAGGFNNILVANGSDRSVNINGNITATNLSNTNTGDNAVNSLYSGLASSKQNTLVSGTNIKTVNSESLLGAGDVEIITNWGFIDGSLVDQTDLQTELDQRVKTLATKTNTTGVPSSTAENSLIGTLFGTNVIDAFTWFSGKSYKISMGGYLSNSAGGNFTLRLKLNSTVLWSITRSDTIGNRGFAMQFLLTCRSTGASGTIFCQQISDGAFGSSTAVAGDVFNTATSTFNTNIDQTIDITYQNATSNANNYGYLTSLSIEELNRSDAS
jgi:hypothetical protein